MPFSTCEGWHAKTRLRFPHSETKMRKLLSCFLVLTTCFLLSCDKLKIDKIDICDITVFLPAGREMSVGYAYYPYTYADEKTIAYSVDSNQNERKDGYYSRISFEGKNWKEALKKCNADAICVLVAESQDMISKWCESQDNSLLTHQYILTLEKLGTSNQHYTITIDY